MLHLRNLSNEYSVNRFILPVFLFKNLSEEIKELNLSCTDLKKMPVSVSKFHFELHFTNTFSVNQLL